MTNLEFCECTGLTPREFQASLESGILEAEMGLRREFTAEQAACARVLKILHNKGVKLRSEVSHFSNSRVL
jgi:hypothetical protein